MTASQPSQNAETSANNKKDNNNLQPVKMNTATETAKKPQILIVDDTQELVEIEPVKPDLSGRNISTDPINYAIDSVDELEFKPSKLSRLRQFVLEEVTRNFNIDPTGEDYIMIVATSADKGQSFKVVGDSTENQAYIGQQVWAKRMIEKEISEMKRTESELINQAKELLKEENSGTAG